MRVIIIILKLWWLILRKLRLQLYIKKRKKLQSKRRLKQISWLNTSLSTKKRLLVITKSLPPTKILVSPT